MAAHAVPGEHAYAPAREAHEETMRKLEQRHPDVKRHALVGDNEDFDAPLNRNEREHQAWMRRQAGLTNTQVNAQRQELRAGDYGRPKPSDIYSAANPDPGPGSPRSGRREGGRARRTLARGGRRTARTLASNAPGPVHDAASIFWELMVAGISISMLYLVLTSTERKGGGNVVTSTLAGITGAFTRLALPTNDLFSAAPKAAAPAPTVRVGVSSPARVQQIQRVLGGPGSRLPDLSNLAQAVPTIP
jgi:hypothetical protein